MSELKKFVAPSMNLWTLSLAEELSYSLLASCSRDSNAVELFSTLKKCRIIIKVSVASFFLIIIIIINISSYWWLSFFSAWCVLTATARAGARTANSGGVTSVSSILVHMHPCMFVSFNINISYSNNNGGNNNKKCATTTTKSKLTTSSNQINK